MARVLSSDPAAVRDDGIMRLRVQHLPPLRLQCELPVAYPARMPPALTFSCVWLDATSEVPQLILGEG